MWWVGLLVGITAFVVLLAQPTPRGLRLAAFRTLLGRLPPSLAPTVNECAPGGDPLSPEFARSFDRCLQVARRTRVALHKRQGDIVPAAELKGLSAAGRRAYTITTLDRLGDQLSRAALCTLAVAALMMALWVFGVFPVPVTALLPLILFPVLGVAHLAYPVFPAGFGVASSYGHYLIFLFMGTFMLSKAMIRWRLDRRVALRILALFGSRPSVLLLGFILSAAFLSMWISNTATAAMMIPIALAVVERVEHPEAERFATGVLLSVAYGATVGGIATLVGSPPNGIYASFVASLAGKTVAFTDWMRFGLPFVVVFLPVLWIAQAVRFIPAGLKLPRGSIETTGPMSSGEKGVAAVFALMVALWLTRSRWSKLSIAGFGLGWANDTTVAILGAVLLFAIPVRRGPTGDAGRTFILDLKTGFDISWGTLILFGGGLALGQAIAGTGLATWFAAMLEVVAPAGPHVVLLTVAAFASVITEVTSNTATATMLMPVLYALGRTMDGRELAFMSTGAVATSLAFMLPIATPPNAVAFGTGRVTMGQMARAGAILNALAVVIWWLVASFAVL
jgi:sodium-dependent dicarboxylate transporter 2/3/5